VWENGVVEPAEPSGEREPGDTGARSLLTLEEQLRRQAADAHLTTGDTLLFTIHAARVIGNLRRVAPELVAAAEREVAEGVVR
jgi:hypothetical protein